jgi:hypothetical protein
MKDEKSQAALFFILHPSSVQASLPSREVIFAEYEHELGRQERLLAVQLKAGAGNLVSYGFLGQEIVLTERWKIVDNRQEAALLERPLDVLEHGRAVLYLMIDVDKHNNIAGGFGKLRIGMAPAQDLRVRQPASLALASKAGDYGRVDLDL